MVWKFFKTQKICHFGTYHFGSSGHSFLTKMKLGLLAGLASSALYLAPAYAVETKAPPVNGEVAEETNKPTTCIEHGAIWWNELVSPERQTLKDFYANVVGWHSQEIEPEEEITTELDNSYTMMLYGEEEIAGMISNKNKMAEKPGVNGWFLYIQVRDVDFASESALREGGTVLHGPLKNSDGDHIAIIKDPSGNIFGLVTPANSKDCSALKTEVTE